MRQCGAKPGRMQGGQFQVVLHALEQAQAHGTESVEFWVAGHAGASTGPIGKVASGGELSRIALAIAVATSQLGQCPTLIFDEVDSGIGGLVANTVGQLMRDLGEHRQVLAVTHLPQVACCAHQHLMVRKSVHNEQVISQVQHLDVQQRIFEIVRMLGGNPNEPASVAHAQHMLQT
jgi:DNA repair protein RecN (Recombination protein N)